MATSGDRSLFLSPWRPSTLFPVHRLGRRDYLFDFTARAVEIYVRFLGVPPREAIQWAGGIVGQLVHAQRLPRDYFGDVHPCDLRRHLWTHLRMAEPMPGLGCPSENGK